MTSVIVSPEAERDLEELTDKIAQAAGAGVAVAYVDRIVAVVETLATIPKASGRPVPKLGLGMRCHPFGNYNLYLCYDEAADTLQLVRVLHGSRNVDATYFKA
jgi:plasmid stabilization system protein ParE